MSVRAPGMDRWLLWFAGGAFFTCYLGQTVLGVIQPTVALGIAVAPMFTSLLTALSNAVEADERGDANALVLTIRWIGAAAGTMVLGVVIHATERHGIPTDSGYSAAFLVAGSVVIVGLLACVFLLRGPHTESKPADHRHHFRPHF